jgi:hypothetical protein
MGSENTFFVQEFSACGAGSATSIVVGPILVSHLRDFSVTCITSATLIVAYSIQLSPYANEGFATAGANWTATSVPAASGADAVVSNKITNNHHAFMRIEASAVSSVTRGDLRFVVHGVKYN